MGGCSLMWRCLTRALPVPRTRPDAPLAAPPPPLQLAAEAPLTAPVAALLAVAEERLGSMAAAQAAAQARAEAVLEAAARGFSATALRQALDGASAGVEVRPWSPLWPRGQTNPFWSQSPPPFFFPFSTPDC